MTVPALALRNAGAIPLVGFGTWQLHGDEAYRAVRAALDAGYRHIDTATMYRNEQQVGRALLDSGLARGEVFVTTKLPAERADRAAETLAASLDALGVDAVDLWLIHWPPQGRSSPGTWEELLAAREKGQAAAVGVSNYNIQQIDELIAASGEAPAVNQIEWSPHLHDPGRLAALRERGIVAEGYSPFKSARLRDRVLQKIAAAHEVSVPQVIVRWHVQHEIVVIPKSARPERIASNIDVFGFELSAEEMGSIDALGR